MHVFATAFGPVAYPSLSAAFNNVGITDDANTSAGDYGGPGYSFSAEALASAGITPGGTVTSGGFSFTWPNVAAGQPDNATPNGQVVTLSGAGSQLAFLGAANNGTATGQVTVGYTDGTTSTGTITLSDWYSNAAVTGDSLVATTAHWNAPSGQPAHQVSLYLSTVPLTAGKTVAYVELPTSGNLHLFATAIS
jgi:beta-glucosidase